MWRGPEPHVGVTARRGSGCPRCLRCGAGPSALERCACVGGEGSPVTRADRAARHFDAPSVAPAGELGPRWRRDRRDCARRGTDAFCTLGDPNVNSTSTYMAHHRLDTRQLLGSSTCVDKTKTLTLDNAPTFDQTLI